MKAKTILLLGILILFPGCRREQPAAHAQDTKSEELATLSVTNWTDKTELFMEYQPLVAGAKRRFAVHFTDLSDFKPLEKAAVIIALRRDGALIESFSTPGPSRPGIFGVDVQPKQPGRYSMSVSVNAPSLHDTHEIGEVVVYSSENEIPPPAQELSEEQIAFLKEQQWSLEFATELARKRSMRESIVVPGDVRPRSGGEVDVAAPIPGRLSMSVQLPVIGTAVAEGQALASIIPLTPAPGDRPSLELAISEARTALDLARRDLARAERLLAVGAIPAKRVDEARAAESTLVARLASAERRLQQFEASRLADRTSGGDSSFTVRAPIAGVIAEVSATPGSNVNQGDRLFRIVAVDRVCVAANVPEAEIPRLAHLNGAEIEILSIPERLSVGRVVAKASVIDPKARTLSVIFEVANPTRTLAIGQAVFVRLFLAGRVDAVTVPESAVVDDGGRPVLFVQKDGEAFVRRPVKLGIRERGVVQIAEGLRPGERVVTKGAYLIRLAALSSQIPAHGHVH